MIRNFECLIKQDVELDIGTHVYVVEADDDRFCKKFTVFSEKCPVCENKKSITINGYTIECSYCRGQKKHVIELAVHDYVVHEYIINVVCIVGSTYKKDYIEKPVCSALFKGFYKSKNGNSDIKYMEFKADSFGKSKIEEINLSSDLREREAFLTKDEAIEFAKVLHQKQKEKLIEFNRSNNTAYDYPFQFERR